MTTLPESRESAARRAVLIDFDWQNADLMPALLRLPDVSVRLVAGEHLDDAGIRVAELCGVRHTIDLADLTREIFDLALVSERSSRRDQMEHLFRALGTPVASPQDYLSRPGLGNTGTKPELPSNGPEARSARDSVPLDPMAELLAQELPDMRDDPAGERGASGSGEPGAAVAADQLDTVARREAATAKPRKGSPVPPPAPTDPSVDLGPLPNPEDRIEIERALGRWAEKTAARTAELHTGVPGQVHQVSRVGAEDPFLDAGRALLLIDTVVWPAACQRHVEPGVIAPSLDVVAWFHRPADDADWLLADAQSPIAESGLIGGTVRIWGADRRLRATGGAQLLCVPAA